MVPADGRKSADLTELLFREPHRFDFFQAVRLLEQMALERVRQDPRCARQPVGQDHSPAEEFVRFRAQPGLGFPTSAVHKISQPADLPASPGRPAPLEMVVNFLGLIGPLGVLPPHYTTLLLQRVRLRDFSLRDFLDLFHHRTISLFYRALEKYKLAFCYERSQQPGTQAETDLCTWCLYCLVGLGTEGLRGRLALDDRTLLYFGGHFAHYPRSACALEGILADYFDLPVHIRQAQGQWLMLEMADRSLLPGPGLPRGQHNGLGTDAIAGERVWDVQGKFRVQLGPLSYTQFHRFLPSGAGLRSLGQLTRMYVGLELAFDVQLVLRRHEVPQCCLSDGESAPAHLGWNTWTASGDLLKDAEEAIFFLEDLEAG